MNETIKKLLTKEASRYKALHEKQIEYDARYLETKYNLETAQKQRQELLNNHELLKADPEKYKETLRIYDKITIPQLKKNLRLAEKKRFENPELTRVDIGFILVGGLIFLPLLEYGGLLGFIISALLSVEFIFFWGKYRNKVKRMVYGE